MLTENTLISLAWSNAQRTSVKGASREHQGGAQGADASLRSARGEHEQPALLSQRSPNRAGDDGQGCWPFHACAICAPPS